MRNERSSRFMFVLPLLIAVLGAAPFDSEAPAGARRKDAEQRFADGNYAEAYSLYR